MDWRYKIKPTPADEFTAQGNPDQAWRAMMGIDYVPYLFPTKTDKNNVTTKHMLAVFFRSRLNYFIDYNKKKINSFLGNPALS